MAAEDERRWSNLCTLGEQVRHAPDLRQKYCKRLLLLLDEESKRTRNALIYLAWAWHLLGDTAAFQLNNLTEALEAYSRESLIMTELAQFRGK